MLNPKMQLEKLSEREREILDVLLKGLSYKDIGDQLFISVNTVKTHTKSIYSKLGFKNRIELLTTLIPFEAVKSPEGVR